MGNRKARRQAFLQLHPYCCFCGGSTTATTIDHLPSRACFDDRHWPDGFAFPACETCNGSTSNAEQVVALQSRVLSDPKQPAKPEEIKKYMRGVMNNYPAIFNNQKAVGRVDLGPELGIGTIIEQNSLVRDLIISVLRKWAKAFHYKETGRIVPDNESVTVQYVSNAEEYSEEIFLGKKNLLTWNGKPIEFQAIYISRNTDDNDAVGSYTIALRYAFVGIMNVAIP